MCSIKKYVHYCKHSKHGSAMTHIKGIFQIWFCNDTHQRITHFNTDPGDFLYVLKAAQTNLSGTASFHFVHIDGVV